jgi:hypothetical protein
LPLISTKTIAQGAARKVGLDEITTVVLSTLSFFRTKSLLHQRMDEQRFRRPTGRITSVIKGGVGRPTPHIYLI